MKQNYNDCLERLLRDEGGYTNDRSDSGGPTNFGITLSDYRAYINKEGTAEDVRKMSVDQAKEIYRTKYWNALGCDNLSSGVDYTVFDYGVNSGLGRPRKALGAFKSLQGTKLITAINNERTAFLKALAANKPKNQKFLKGWLNRVSRVNSYSLQLAGKNSVAGPIAGGVVIGSTAVVHHSVFYTHPIISCIAAVAAAVVIGYVVHLIINKGK